MLDKKKKKTRRNIRRATGNFRGKIFLLESGEHSGEQRPSDVSVEGSQTATQNNTRPPLHRLQRRPRKYTKQKAALQCTKNTSRRDVMQYWGNDNRRSCAIRDCGRSYLQRYTCTCANSSLSYFNVETSVGRVYPFLQGRKIRTWTKQSLHKYDTPASITRTGFTRPAAVGCG